MGNYLLSLHLDPALVEAVPEAWLLVPARASLEQAGVKGPAEVGLVLTDDATVQRLNRQYRQVDEPTDVLSFPLVPWGQPSGGQTEADSFVVPPDGVLHLGEVIISLPNAQRQAAQQGHELRQELAHLTAHGVLHLLGYDHQKEPQAKEMFALESAILRGLWG